MRRFLAHVASSHLLTFLWATRRPVFSENDECEVVNN